MTKLKSTSTSGIWNSILLRHLFLLLVVTLLWPGPAEARIYIDINAPSIQKINIAIPDFKNLSDSKKKSELATAMPAVVANDLDLSGYFTPMDKSVFQEEEDSSTSLGDVRLRDWSVIGAELLLKAGYSFIGRSIELEARLYDVYRGRQILGKRLLGKKKDYRKLMHRLSNDIIYALTGYKGMFLSKFAFVGSSTGHKEVYTCDFDGQNVKRITSHKSVAMFPRWSPKGDQIIFTSFKDGGPMLYRMNMKSRKVHRVSGRKGLNVGGTWAPDGKSLALTLSHGKNPDLYQIDLKGKVIKRLVSHWSVDISPAFSPKGDKVAFVSERSGRRQIHVKDLNDGKMERVFYSKEKDLHSSPSWSRLNRIAFARSLDGARWDIFTMSPNGSNIRQLTENQGSNEDPAWSPDGRYIVFTSNRTGRYHLYIMNANGQNQRRITSSKGEERAPSWSPY